MLFLIAVDLGIGGGNDLVGVALVRHLHAVARVKQHRRISTYYLAAESLKLTLESVAIEVGFQRDIEVVPAEQLGEGLGIADRVLEFAQLCIAVDADHQGDAFLGRGLLRRGGNGSEGGEYEQD